MNLRLKAGLLAVALFHLGLEATLAAPAPALAQSTGSWFQLQTKNFTIFSGGRIEDTRRLALKLEQFRQAYSRLAGAQAVVSVPVIVVAFPDSETFRPFQPLYQGEPTPVGGFFQQDYDENVIAVNLKSMESGSMAVIFHEYAHLLMRHNNRVWPLWLMEGMAEVYSTFAMDKNRVSFGAGKTRHIEFLQKHPLMPLKELFGVQRDSPQYNEREYRGVLYAESWALTHYLVVGDHPVRKAQYKAFDRGLRQGIPVERAFTNSFQTDLASMEQELKRYLARSRFEPLYFNVDTGPEGETAMAGRPMPQVEVLFQLGNLLLHCKRLDEAEKYFQEAQRIAPESPRPSEGLGLAAARRKRHAEAIRFCEQAISRNSFNFRVHYIYASELYETAVRENIGTKLLSPEAAEKLRTALHRSIQLMPSFSPSHYLLGLVELARAEGQVRAGQHLRTAIRLDPENKGYVLTLAELQLQRHEFIPARQTLTLLLKPDVDPNVRRRAEALVRQLEGPAKGLRRPSN